MDLSYALDYPAVSSESPRQVHLLVRLETWPEEGGAGSKPLNLALVLDRSGSMAGAKLAATQEAAGALIKRLTPQDSLSVVAFDSRVEVVVPSGPVIDPDWIIKQVESISAGSATNLSGGWLRALSLVEEQRGAESLNRVLLLTDGQANEGITDRPSLAEIARRYREADIATTTLGFGDGFNEGDLAAIAEAGGGRFYYIGSCESASTCFLEEFGDLTRIFGQNCEMTVVPSDGIPIPEILGAAPASVTERAQTIAFGDVRERDSKRLLAAFSLPDVLAQGERELAVVNVRYDGVRGKTGARRHILSVKLLVAAEPRGPVPEVQRELVWHEASECKRRAAEKLGQGDPDGAISDLAAAADLLAKHANLDPELFDREAAMLRALADQARRSDRSIRKNLAAQAHDLKGQRGSYERSPAAERRTFTLTPRTPEILDDAADHAESMLKKFGYEEDLIRRFDYALRELGANALEHGCRDQLSPRVDVDLQLGRNYAKVCVRDNGAGFEFEATLQREAAAAPGGKRGRGLISVRRGVDSLTANAKGDEVTAAIRRRQVRFSIEKETLLSMEGVGEAVVLPIRGFLDSHTFEELERTINELFAKGQYRIIADLSGCDYISSAGGGVFIGAIGTAQENGGDIVIVSPSTAVREVFDLLGLSQLFSFAESVAQAREHFERGG